jgi:hypothetical protein
MLLSKATGRAYCRDEKACDLRKPTKEALMADGSTTSDLLTMEM